eukprot:gene6794-4875_t
MALPLLRMRWMVLLHKLEAQHTLHVYMLFQKRSTHGVNILFLSTVSRIMCVVDRLSCGRNNPTPLLLPVMINTVANLPGDYWSNRDVKGLFKNYGTAILPPVPFTRRLKHICRALCCPHLKPAMGYEAMHRQWHTRCEPQEPIAQVRATIPLEGPTAAAENPLEGPTAAAENPLKDLIFWLGHASQLLCLVQPDINILLDPIFSERASPLRHWGPKRRFPPPLAVEELPRIDFVLVSHNHYDHLDSQSIRAVYKRFPSVHFVLPKNMSTLLKPWGIPADAITELDWWEEAELLLWRGGEAKGVRLRIACTPAQHWGLHAMGDRNKVLWCGWVLGWKHLSEKPREDVRHMVDGSGPLRATGPLYPSPAWDWSAVKTYSFTGDTAFHREMFEQIHLHYPRIDMAGLPIGAYHPREMMHFSHIDPQSAVEIFFIMEIRQAYGLHWGTFELGGEPMDEPPEVLQEVAAERNLRCSGGGEVQDGEERAFRLIQTGGYLLF